jgi:hypothetical protein
VPDNADQVLGTELRIFPRVAKDCAETYLIHTPARERKGSPQYFEDLAVGTASKQAH